MLEWSGKFLTMAGVIMLALSITPTGDWLDPREAWWRTQGQWIQRTLYHGEDATPVLSNPLWLYGGIIVSMVGIALT
jgi:hypothetical protein